MNITIKNFEKPTHETDGKYWINLQIEYVKRVKTAKKFIVIKLPQGFCQPVNPNNLLKYGKKTEAVYLYPNNQMKLVGQYYELFNEGIQERIKFDPYFFENL